MFFFFSKFLLFLIQPLNWIAGSLLISLFSKKPRLKRRALRVAIGIFLFISSPLIGNIAADLFEAEPIKISNLKDNYDYGIVLGGFSNLESVSGEDRLNLNFNPNRITHAYDLYKQGKIKKILLTGGNGNIIGQKENEALKTSAFLQRVGVPKTDIIIESRSRNTYENFKFTKELLVKSKGKNLVITSAFHVPRSRAIAHKMDFNCTFFPTDFYKKEWLITPTLLIIPSVESIKMWQVLIKEWFGQLAYKMKGYT